MRQRPKSFKIWSGRWESNPRPKLGKLLYCHCTTPAFLSSRLYTTRRLHVQRGYFPYFPITCWRSPLAPVPVEFVPCIAPSSTPSCDPSPGAERQDSYRTTPTFDCGHDEMPEYYSPMEMGTVEFITVGLRAPA